MFKATFFYAIIVKLLMSVIFSLKYIFLFKYLDLYFESIFNNTLKIL